MGRVGWVGVSREGRGVGGGGVSDDHNLSRLAAAVLTLYPQWRCQRPRFFPRSARSIEQTTFHINCSHSERLGLSL